MHVRPRIQQPFGKHLAPEPIANATHLPFILPSIPKPPPWLRLQKREKRKTSVPSGRVPTFKDTLLPFSALFSRLPSFSVPVPCSFVAAKRTRPDRRQPRSFWQLLCSPGVEGAARIELTEPLTTAQELCHLLYVAKPPCSAPPLTIRSC